MGAPPLTHCVALVVARVIQHDDHGLIGGEGVGQFVEEGHEGVFILARVDLVNAAPTCIVQTAKHRALVVVAGGRNSQGLPATSPDLCQRGMSVDLAVVHVDQMESSGLSNAFFSSQSKTCLAAATASAS